MADYSTLLRDHVTLRSIDRIFLQAYVPGSKSELLSASVPGRRSPRALSPSRLASRTLDDFVFTPPTVRVDDQGGTVRLQWRPR